MNSRSALPIRAASVLAALSLLFAAGPASAIQIVDGLTTIEVTAFPLIADASPEAIDPGTAFLDSANDRLFTAFPVTGGDVDASMVPASGTVEHAGGVSLTVDGSSLSLTDFLIDLDQATVFGDVSGAVEAMDAPLFSIQVCDAQPGGCVVQSGIAVTGLGLYLTETSAGVLGEFLGVEPALLDGAPFGIATSTLVPIPEPGTALLLGAGFLGVALRRRRGRSRP